MDIEMEHLVQAWMLRFCEAPVLIDKELMRQVLADGENDHEDDR